MAKQLMFDDEARRKVLAGLRKLSSAVKVTLGPSGRNVLLEKKFGGPQATRDGVTVSKDIELPDPFENVGQLGSVTFVFQRLVGRKILEDFFELK